MTPSLALLKTVSLAPSTVAIARAAMRTLRNREAFAVALGAWRMRIEIAGARSIARRDAIVEAVLAIEVECATDGPCVDCDGTGKRPTEMDAFDPYSGHYTITVMGCCNRCGGTGRAGATPFERLCDEAAQRGKLAAVQRMFDIAWQSAEATNETDAQALAG